MERDAEAGLTRHSFTYMQRPAEKNSAVKALRVGAGPVCNTLPVRWLRWVVVGCLSCGPTGRGDINGDGDGDGDGDRDAGPVTCESPQLIGMLNLGDPPDMLVLLDRSGSMTLVLDGLPNTRWEIMQAAVKELTAGLDDYLHFGLSVFPNYADCEVASDIEIPIADLNATAIADFIDGQWAAGNTPTLQALENAAAHYQSIPVNPAGQFVILATDGAPNCGFPPDASVVQLGELAGAGIQTFVLGVGDSIDLTLDANLNDMAQAGGVPRSSGPPYYYPAANVQELEDAFRAMALIAFQPACSYTVLTEDALDPRRVSVTLGGTPIPWDTDHLDGWDFSADNVISFFGTSCTEIEAGRFQEIEVAVCL
jgi:hypothetical protein